MLPNRFDAGCNYFGVQGLISAIDKVFVPGMGDVQKLVEIAAKADLRDEIIVKLLPPRPIPKFALGLRRLARRLVLFEKRLELVKQERRQIPDNGFVATIPGIAKRRLFLVPTMCLVPACDGMD
jgi:hypothetical protein